MMRETETSDPEERTRHNVIDSSGTLVLIADDGLPRSPGTDYTAKFAAKAGRSVLISALTRPESGKERVEFIQSLGEGCVLNVAGPRESEQPGIYELASVALAELFATNSCATDE